jgi:hypothetical protein
MNLPKTLKMPSLSSFGKRLQGILRKSNYTWLLWLFSFCDISHIFNIRNIRKFPSPSSRNTLISSSEKSSWSLKTSFGRNIFQQIQKWSWKFFRHKGFHSFGTSCLDVLKPRRNFSWPLLTLLDHFSSKMMFFKLQEVFSDLGIKVFLENGLGSFRSFLILQIWDKPEVLERFQKQNRAKSNGSFSSFSWFTAVWHVKLTAFFHQKH